MAEQRYKILYIDDEEVNLRLLKSTFRREFDVYAVSNAKDGLKILEDVSIDVVITDQRMPEMTGVEFLKIVNDRFANIPPNRLILSGYSDFEQIEKAFHEYKLFKFISKPWNEEQLRTIIYEAINLK